MDSRALSRILAELTAAARAAGLSDAAWARRAGLPKETLCRLRRRSCCDFSTLQALATAVARDCRLHAGADASADGLWPRRVDRALESQLRALVLRRSFSADAWRAIVPPFFAAGLAVMLASIRGLPRARYLALAEQLHPGATELSVFRRWLAATPLPPSRFLPQLLGASGRAA